MHLSDQQLLEVDEVDQVHLEQCKSCRRRANHLIKMRQYLKAVPLKDFATDGWQEIQTIHNQREQLVALRQARKQVNRWKTGSLALAASLIAVVFWQSTQRPIISLGDQELAKLIEQNNALQQRLDTTTPLYEQSNVKLQMLQLDIQNLDQQIQRAYLQGDSNQSKAELWEKRKKLVKQLSSKTKKVNTLSI